MNGLTRDSFCPYALSSEITAKGTGLDVSAGKEDPVELVRLCETTSEM